MPISLDAQTLYVTVVIAAFLGGLLLLWAWHQNRSVAALFWWGAAYLIGALGLTLLVARGTIHDLLTIDLANALILTAYGMIWASARDMGRRRPQVLASLAGALIWLAACRVPAFYGDLEARTVLASSLITTYLLLTAHAFWTGHDRLPSQRAGAVVVFLHALFMIARIPATLVWGQVAALPLSFSLSTGLMSLETLIFVHASAFLLVTMAKERVELHHKAAALIDPLTGIANRRAFLADAARLVDRQRRPSGASLLLFDLDHFKRVNDSHGHHVGDQALKLFCAAAEPHLHPAADLFGRLGGEEFAALVTATDPAAAERVAAAIVADFAAAASTIDGRAVGATVSAGVSWADGSPDFADLLLNADRALYRAKALGRNRVEAVRPAVRPVPRAVRAA